MLRVLVWDLHSRTGRPDIQDIKQEGNHSTPKNYAWKSWGQTLKVQRGRGASSSCLSEDNLQVSNAEIVCAFFFYKQYQEMNQKCMLEIKWGLSTCLKSSRMLKNSSLEQLHFSRKNLGKT